MPTSGNGVEIGVGTGRVAESLGVAFGIEPAVAMGAIAAARGIQVITGKAELLMITLYQFPISHYCEKVRWALDYKGLDWSCKNLLVGPHISQARTPYK